MKIIIAPDSFKESLTAQQVADAIETGWRQVWPAATIVKLPMADGGEGTVQALVDASGGERRRERVTGPTGEPVAAIWGLMGDGETAVIEMAAASGLHLVPPAERNPLKTTSYGTGQLIKAALDHGARRLIIGIGGSATNDGGVGMAQALGVHFTDASGTELGAGGGALARLQHIDIQGLDPRLADADIRIACDVDNPLCGERGASAVFGPQKGATGTMIQQLDANLAHYAHVLKTDLDQDVATVAGAGAAGGMGAALLAFCGAHLQPGIDIVTTTLNLAGHLHDADLVITGEGRIDGQTLSGKTPIGVTRVARAHGVPVIALAGSIRADYAPVHDAGIEAVFGIVPGAVSLEDAFADAAENLTRTAANVARLMRLSGWPPAQK